MRRRLVHRIQRHGGGTYRRGGRWYWSSLCEECIRNILSYTNDTQTSANSYSVRSLRKALEHDQTA